MTPRSLRGQLLAWSAGLTVLALGAAWLGLTVVLSDFVQTRLQAELRASLRAVMASAQWTDAGVLVVTPPPPDPRFEQPLSGWFWQVSDGQQVLARASSLVTGTLGAEGLAQSGPDGEPLQTLRQAFTAPGDGRSLVASVSLPQSEARDAIARIRAPIWIGLALLGGALALAQVIAIRLGLRDLTRFAAQVSAIRQGKADTVDVPQMTELQPLAAELTRLLAANAAQIARARAAAADLAHALKTPLAVLSNRATPEDAEVLSRLDRMIRWHLTRARQGADGGDPAARCPVAPVLQDVVLVVGADARRRAISFTLAVDDAPDFRGDPEDLGEIVAALAENAVGWAKGQVRITARADDDLLRITIDDDGPGIAPQARAALLQRGARLDSRDGGHGLGLAIADDRVRAYGGQLRLDASDLGGLRVDMRLPAWPAEPRTLP